MTTTLSQTEGAREARARRQARHLGCVVSKVRNWNRWLGNDGYIITTFHGGNLVRPAGGAQTPLTLDELEEWLSSELAYEQELVARLAEARDEAGP